MMMGQFFTALPNRKWPVVWGPPPYGIWPATRAVVPGVHPQPKPADTQDWMIADAAYRAQYGLGSSIRRNDMFGYQQSYRPGFAYPLMAQAAAAPASAPTPATVLTPAQRTGAIVIGSAETAFGVAASWIGVRAGLKDKGIFSALGWLVAAGGAVFTVINLAGTIGVIRS